MKQFLCFTGACLALTVPPRACCADERLEEKPRMKGVELYSWKDKEGRQGRTSRSSSIAVAPPNQTLDETADKIQRRG